MKYRVLDDIAYEVTTTDANGLAVPGNAVYASASLGDIVELTPKDAAALMSRGAVEPIKEG